MSQLTLNRDAGMIAHEINIIKDQANKLLLQSSIEIGRRLKEAKEMVGHGNWSKWLEEEVNYSQRTASNLIKINEEYGAKVLGNSNSQALANLGYTQAVALLKLDIEARENFLVVHNIEEMSTRQINSEIKVVKEVDKSKDELQKEIKKLEGSHEKLEKELKKKINDIETKEKEIKKYIGELKILDKKINQKVKDGISDKEIKKLKDDLRIKKQTIVKLQNDLKTKPKEVEVPQISYEIPPEISKELEELEKLRSQVETSENAMKFKMTFDTLIDRFNILLGVLEDIKKNEPKNYEKYKGAVNKLLTKLKIE